METSQTSPPTRSFVPATSAVLAFLVGLALVGGTARVTAQVTDDALRRDLVAQAEAARDANDHARAYDLATRAATIRVSPSLSLMLAQEGTELGRLVEALDHARRCASEARAVEALRNRDRILHLCETMVTDLDQQVARVTVTVPAESAEGASVEVAGHTLPPSAWGVAVPVNPGDVTVQARTSDGRTFARALHLARGERSMVSVVFGVSTRLRSLDDASSAPPTQAPPQRPIVDQPAPPLPSRGVGAGPWVLVGAGAVAFGVSGVLWAMHGSAISDRDAACDASGCDPSAINANDSAHTLTAATNVSIALGAASAAAGVAWFLIASTRSTSSTAQRHSLLPIAWMTSNGGALGLGGTL